MQPLLDRITSLAGESVALNRDLPEQDAHITALEENPRSAIASVASPFYRAHEITASMGIGSRKEIKLFRNPAAAAEDAAFAKATHHDEFMQHHKAHVHLASDMFRAMHAASCPLAQARLGLL